MAEAAAYATLAGQASKPPTIATIEANAKIFAGAVSNSFLGTPTTTVIFNNPITAKTDNAAGSKCCIGAAWSCSTSTITCADTSSPGTYLSISVSYPFNAFLAADSAIIGKTLSASIVAPMQ